MPTSVSSNLGTSSVLRSATLARIIAVLLVLSAGLLGRSLYLALVKLQGPVWVRAVVLGATPAIALIWAFRFGWVAL